MRARDTARRADHLAIGVAVKDHLAMTGLTAS